MPIDQWGTKFPLIPFMYASETMFQFVADTDGTIVEADERTFQLNASEYEAVVIDNATILTSNFPIQLIQIGQVPWAFEKSIGNIVLEYRRSIGRCIFSANRKRRQMVEYAGTVSTDRIHWRKHNIFCSNSYNFIWLRSYSNGRCDYRLDIV